MDAAEPGEPGGYGDRHQARERALALLYEAEQRQSTVAEVLDALPLAPDRYARALVEGVAEHRAELDALIAGASRHWALDRMPLLDRTILQIGAFELHHRPDVPVAVAIDEAVELAKTYCGDESPGFVNGVLARLADDRST
jgi:transcription antitermination protein NusB